MNYMVVKTMRAHCNNHPRLDELMLSELRVSNQKRTSAAGAASVSITKNCNETA